MQSITVNELDRLHDSDLLSVVYDTSGDADWPIRVTIKCPDDLGYTPWDGRLLVLTAINVVGSKHVVWCVAGPETIDHVHTGVSAALREGAMKGRPASTHFNFEFTIALVSGSSIEIICQDILVEVKG